ncbi:ArnT family glycosyltransferase [Comamonas sp. GB3 AK4-5]|uniref:ArnT family glycosyltransferase n=1 Tax=Comamonas sp. GB3 AK4-5 TaxID=3231487 RepID=UPI00351E7B1C
MDILHTDAFSRTRRRIRGAVSHLAPTPLPWLQWGRRSESVAMALGIALLLAITAWMRPLMLPDEGRYVTVAWEMLRSGDWLTPSLNGLPFFHKPPLFYWVTALALKLGGMHEGAGRAAPLLGAWMAIWSLYLFTRRWYGLQTARYAVAVLLAWPLFYLGGQFANLDMLVAGCITATVLALAHAALCFEQGLPSRRSLLLAYGLAALGVLAKGLIGLVLPALVVGCWLLLRRRWRSIWALCSLPGVLLFALVAVPWFWLMQLRFPDFLHYFFVVQHLQRFAASGFNNVQPWWFYPAVLALSSLPFWLWSRAMWARSYWRVAEQDAIDQAAAQSVRLLMACFAAVVVLFFSWPASKLVGYVLPAVPALAWLMGDAIAMALASHPERRHLWWLSLAVGACASLAVLLYLAQDQRYTARDLGRALAAQHRPSEPVFMVDTYLYDTPFYARLQAPMLLVSPWSEPIVNDNWRKEVKDAAAFLPVQAGRTLLEPGQWQQRLCSTPVSWVVGKAALVQRYPALAAATVVASDQLGQLWRVDLGRPAEAAAWACGSAAPN